MTDRSGRVPVDGVDNDGPELLGDVLDSFKTGEGDAEELAVIDGIGGRPRLTWNPVTDTGGAAAPAESDSDEASSFRFDLGGALAKLAGDDDAPPSETQAESQAPPAPAVVAPRPTPEPPVASSTPPADIAPAVSTPNSPPVPAAPAAPAVASIPPPVPATPAPAAQAPAAQAPSVAPAPSAGPMAPTVPPSPPKPEPALHELIAHRPTERNVFGDQSLPSRSDAPVAPIADPAPVATPPAAERTPPERDLFADRATPPSMTPQPTARPESAPSDYPRRVPGANLESQLRRDPEPAELPEIKDATPVDDPLRPIGTVSVFDDIATGPTRTSQAVPTVPTAPTLPTPPMVGGAGAPVVSESMAPNVGGTGVPMLPASNPVAPPPLATFQSSGPSTNDLNALRSAQARGGRQPQRGRVFGRSLLALVLIGGLIGAGLVFGRSLLFTTEWDAQLTPVVNDIQEERGAEFDHAVALVALPATEFGDHLRAATIGEAWLERVPEWRALGLTTGNVTPESVGTALSASTTAMYDPVTDTVYQIESADPNLAERDLRVALEQAFEQQVGTTAVDATELDATATDMPGFTGVSSPMAVASRAVDEVLAGGVASVRRPADELLPMPIAYEFAAVEILGQPILDAVGINPATLTIGTNHPTSIGDALSDHPVSATSGILQPGDVSLAGPVALGNDDWSLVWGARLPKSTVDQLVGQVTADSYRVIERGGNVCVFGVFQTSSAADGSAVFAAMLTWASQSAPAAQATATALGPTRTMIEACDPGAGAGLVANPGAVDALIDRQQARLTN